MEKEIITALDACISGKCWECVRKDNGIKTFGFCRISLMKEAKAEIERLKAEIKKPVCMPGDTVYFLASGGEAYPATVRKIIYDTSWIAFEETAIGKQVFLTKEAAERAGADNDN